MSQGSVGPGLDMSTSRKSLSEVLEMIGTAHNCLSVNENINFYDNCAPEYDELVDVLEYNAPRLATECLASAIPTDRDSKLVLDVACGTGLVAEELSRLGFKFFHGVDGSEQMLEIARQKNLYQELKQCILGQEPLPTPAELYDAVIIVGALSEGQVPSSVIPELLTLTKPGGFVCLTTRCNASNLQYKSRLDTELREMADDGIWEHVNALSVADWEKATSVEEARPGSEYISGVVYVFRKSEFPPREH